MKAKALTKDEIESIVASAVEEAVDFVESEIAPDRVKAQRYFDGAVDIGHEPGRSKVVSTKVRDVVRGIKPSLMRVFLSSERPVEFLPMGQEDVESAEQANKYMHWKFSEIGGYKILNDAFHDALIKKSGIVKVYWETYEKAEVYTFNDLSDAEFSLVVNEDDIDVIEHSEETSVEIDEMGLETSETTHSIKIIKKEEDGRLCVESVPPEEFFVDRNARSIDDAYVVCQRSEMRVGDLVEMGFEFDEVSNLSGLSESASLIDEEQFARSGYYHNKSEEDHKDPSMKRVLVTEAYMSMDIDGSGVPMMYKFMLGGSSYKMLDYEVCDGLPFAVFECDPEPHTFYGRSIADLVINDQDSTTAMLRGILDNVALTNNPSLDVIEDLVNMDDVLNNEIGAIRRVKQMGAIQANSIPFVAGTTLPALQYMDDQVEVKTGVSRASMGLDPDALQNATATAVTLTMSAAAGQIEVIARNFAEGGLKQMFKLMLSEMIKNSEDEVMMRLNGRFIPIDPRVWNADMDLTINVGLGTGKEEQRLAGLNQALQMQMQIWQTYGPQNGLVTMTQIRNSMADMLAISGVRNADRYFMPMDQQTEQMLNEQAMQAQQAAGQNQPDPNAAYLQAEQMKVQSKQQSDMMSAQIDVQKSIAKDDLERDKMDQELLIKAAETVGKYGTAVDVARIKTLQNEPRQ
tara:strand:+ start:8717 stop:10774 length:2058 start_codon:yes stop_codon:yes gene_type:complete